MKTGNSDAFIDYSDYSYQFLTESIVNLAELLIDTRYSLDELSDAYSRYVSAGLEWRERQHKALRAVRSTLLGSDEDALRARVTDIFNGNDANRHGYNVPDDVVRAAAMDFIRNNSQ